MLLRNKGKMKHCKDKGKRKKLRDSQKKRKEPSLLLREPKKNKTSEKLKIER